MRKPIVIRPISGSLTRKAGTVILDPDCESKVLSEPDRRERYPLGYREGS